MPTKTLKKKSAPVDEVVEPVSAPQWARPVQIVIDVVFEEGNRKVTTADLERAAEAATAAAKTSLESRTPSYLIAEMKTTVTYAYVMVKKVFTS